MRDRNHPSVVLWSIGNEIGTGEKGWGKTAERVAFMRDFEVVDGEGNPCPLSDDKGTFSVDGPAEIAGIGNGNPLSMEPFRSSSHSLFHGKAMLIIRSIEVKSGAVNVTANADGSESAQVRIDTKLLSGN
ncbi:MAG: hypothetical protein JXR49_06440 [Acidobacteria bacterium]|nr:hypothetical protein [Acidobacteriota bacterium]